MTLRTVSGLSVQIAEDATPDEEMRATVSRTVYELASSTNNAAREFGPLELRITFSSEPVPASSTAAAWEVPIRSTSRSLSEAPPVRLSTSSVETLP